MKNLTMLLSFVVLQSYSYGAIDDQLNQELKSAMVQTNWAKSSTHECSKIYPDKIMFKGNGLYSAEGGSMVHWDGGWFKLKENSKIHIMTSTDATEILSILITADGKLQFMVKPQGANNGECKFEYKQIQPERNDNKLTKSLRSKFKRLNKLLNEDGNSDWKVDIKSIKCIAVEGLEGGELIGTCLLHASSAPANADAIFSVVIQYNYNEGRQVWNKTILSLKTD